MHTNEKNISKDSEFFVYSANEITKKNFFYPICVGKFQYLPNYKLTRDCYDSFLIMLIQKGCCYIEVDEKIYHANKGDIILIDCYSKHSYTSKSGWQALWLHFNGPLARLQFTQLQKMWGPIIVLSNIRTIEYVLDEIFFTFKSNSLIFDAKMSKHITDILTEMFLKQRNDQVFNNYQKVKKAISYINEYYTQNISLVDLSSITNLSLFHFSRIFHEEVGMSPYQYIISIRIESSKFLLKTTTKSIKEIAFSSGFTSESNFCSCFKKKEEITPSKYRNNFSIQQ